MNLSVAADASPASKISGSRSPPSTAGGKSPMSMRQSHANRKAKAEAQRWGDSRVALDRVLKRLGRGERFASIAASAAGMGIGDDGCKELAEAMSSVEQGLIQLQLRGNQVTSVGAAALAKALLRHSTTLRKLDLANNDICELGAAHIMVTLKKGSALKFLTLRHNVLADGGALNIADALGNHPELEEVDLGENEIGPVGAHRLAEVMMVHPVLCTLNLDGNPLGDEGAAAIAAALAPGVCLEEPEDVTMEEVGPDGSPTNPGKEVPTAGSSSSTAGNDAAREIFAVSAAGDAAAAGGGGDGDGADGDGGGGGGGADAANNTKAGDDSAPPAGAAATGGGENGGGSDDTTAARSKRRKKKGQAGDEGGEVIVNEGDNPQAGLATQGSFEEGAKGLHSLHLSNCQIGDAGAKKLAMALKLKPGLEELHLTKNRLTDASLEAFTDVIEIHEGLRSLDLSENRLTDAATLRLVGALSRLERRDLVCNLIGNPITRFNEVSLTNLTLAAETAKKLALRGITCRQIFKLWDDFAASREIDINTATTRTVVKKIVKPYLENKKVSFSAFLHAPTPTVHVVHSWDNKFEDLVKGVIQHATGILEPSLDHSHIMYKHYQHCFDKCYFIDFLAIDQNIDEPLGDSFCQTDKFDLVLDLIRRRGDGEVLFIVGSEYQTLTRTWCLFEAQMAVKHQLPLTFYFGIMRPFPRRRKELLFADGAVTRPGDKAWIDSEVEARGVGVANFDEVVTKVVKESIIERYLEFFKQLPLSTQEDLEWRDSQDNAREDLGDACAANDLKNIKVCIDIALKVRLERETLKPAQLHYSNLLVDSNWQRADLVLAPGAGDFLDEYEPGSLDFDDVPLPAREPTILVSRRRLASERLEAAMQKEAECRALLIKADEQEEERKALAEKEMMEEMARQERERQAAAEKKKREQAEAKQRKKEARAAAARGARIDAEDLLPSKPLLSQPPPGQKKDEEKTKEGEPGPGQDAESPQEPKKRTRKYRKKYRRKKANGDSTSSSMEVEEELPEPEPLVDREKVLKEQDENRHELVEALDLAIRENVSEEEIAAARKTCTEFRLEWLSTGKDPKELLDMIIYAREICVSVERLEAALDALKEITEYRVAWGAKATPSNSRRPSETTAPEADAPAGKGSGGSGNPQEEEEREQEQQDQGQNQADGEDGERRPNAFGLVVEPAGTGLNILEIIEDGRVGTWNAKHSGREVQPGDCILSVDGLTDPERLEEVMNKPLKADCILKLRSRVYSDLVRADLQLAEVGEDVPLLKKVLARSEQANLCANDLAPGRERLDLLARRNGFAGMLRSATVGTVIKSIWDNIEKAKDADVGVEEIYFQKARQKARLLELEDALTAKKGEGVNLDHVKEALGQARAEGVKRELLEPAYEYLEQEDLEHYKVLLEEDLNAASEIERIREALSRAEAKCLPQAAMRGARLKLQHHLQAVGLQAIVLAIEAAKSAEKYANEQGADESVEKASKIVGELEGELLRRQARNRLLAAAALPDPEALEEAVQEAIEANVEKAAIVLARQRGACLELKTAEESGDIDALLSALERARAAEVEQEDVERAKLTLRDLDIDAYRGLLMVELKEASEGDNLSLLHKLLQEAEAAEVEADAMRPARARVAQLQMQDAISLENFHALEAAIEAGGKWGVPQDELASATVKLAEFRLPVVYATRDPIKMREAVEEAERQDVDEAICMSGQRMLLELELETALKRTGFEDLPEIDTAIAYAEEAEVDAKIVEAARYEVAQRRARFEVQAATAGTDTSRLKAALHVAVECGVAEEDLREGRYRLAYLDLEIAISNTSIKLLDNSVEAARKVNMEEAMLKKALVRVAFLRLLEAQMDVDHVKLRSEIEAAKAIGVDAKDIEAAKNALRKLNADSYREVVQEELLELMAAQQAKDKTKAEARALKKQQHWAARRAERRAERAAQRKEAMGDDWDGQDLSDGDEENDDDDQDEDEKDGADEDESSEEEEAEQEETEDLADLEAKIQSSLDAGVDPAILLPARKRLLKRLGRQALKMSPLNPGIAQEDIKETAAVADAGAGADAADGEGSAVAAPKVTGKMKRRARRANEDATAEMMRKCLELAETLGLSPLEEEDEGAPADGDPEAQNAENGEKPEAELAQDLAAASKEQPEKENEKKKTHEGDGAGGQGEGGGGEGQEEKEKVQEQDDEETKQAKKDAAEEFGIRQALAQMKKQLVSLDEKRYFEKCTRDLKNALDSGSIDELRRAMQRGEAAGVDKALIDYAKDLLG